MTDEETPAGDWKHPSTAEQVLDNFEAIVKRERLMRGSYVVPARYLHNSQLVGNEKELKEGGAICGGARACAIGSFGLATGEPWTGVYDVLDRIAATPHQRLALAALNRAAEEYAAKHNLEVASDFVAPLESLFEGPTIRELAGLPEYDGPGDDDDDCCYDEEAIGRGLTGVMLAVSARARELLAGVTL